MWKLEIGKGGSWLKSKFNHLGREIWVYDEQLGSSEEREAVENARKEFWRNSRGFWTWRHGKARKWILDHGRITIIPTWGKFWLSVLGVFEWSGVNPIPPDLILLPSSLPIYLGRLWCHFRLIYAPMSYLYGKRFVGPITKTVLELRDELHSQPYQSIDWNKARKMCAKGVDLHRALLMNLKLQEDFYQPHSLFQDYLAEFLYRILEPLFAHWPLSVLRKKALQEIMQYIHYEDENSLYLSVGAAQQTLCMLSCWVENPSADTFKFHLARILIIYGLVKMA
uniref:Squalene cyclase N-terminal domain-containing protein n=1 Tax=Ananas comosus var. bracteatus TaxID=296719 RepID=A0A6V7NXS9_ANACO|nr:unnamed protein product [Ananas comosus var. bracteatus]